MIKVAAFRAELEEMAQCYECAASATGYSVSVPANQ